MKKELDDLWYSYLVETILKKSDNEKELIKQFSVDDKALREALNNEQKQLLEKYDQSSSIMNSLTEKFAFVKGVKFAVRFLFEALCED
ncbi:MAG: hypothetical protein IJZ16_13245 [Clostridia bacterium]|nr:hypothetical protein [Clostridia bacterium]